MIGSAALRILCRVLLQRGSQSHLLVVEQNRNCRKRGQKCRSNATLITERRKLLHLTQFEESQRSPVAPVSQLLFVTLRCRDAECDKLQCQHLMGLALIIDVIDSYQTDQSAQLSKWFYVVNCERPETLIHMGVELKLLYYWYWMRGFIKFIPN